MAKNLKAKQTIYEEEIDLTPYIRKISKHKWLLIGSLVVGCLIGYFGSYLIPARYQMGVVLSFQSKSNLIPSSYVLEFTKQFESTIDAKKNPEYKDFIDITVQGKDYPLSIVFTVKGQQTGGKLASKFLEELKNSDYVKKQIEERRQYLSRMIDDHTDMISKIENEINLIKSTSIVNGDTCSVTTLPALYRVISEVSKEKNELQQERDSLQGFVYSISPYLLNNGRPVYPKKGANSAVGGVLLTFIVGSIVVFKKERKDKKD